MYFAIVAKDAPGSETQERRLAARPEHMDGLRRLRIEGHMIDGGAILDEAGRLVGSVLLCDFPDRAALDAYLGEEALGRPFTSARFSKNTSWPSGSSRRRRRRGCPRWRRSMVLSARASADSSRPVAGGSAQALGRPPYDGRGGGLMCSCSLMHCAAASCSIIAGRSGSRSSALGRLSGSWRVARSSWRAALCARRNCCRCPGSAQPITCLRSAHRSSWTAPG